ncbi:MAG: endonuclease/exonuclease/phosphatase family protein, partial [Nocardioides sp.]
YAAFRLPGEPPGALESQSTVLLYRTDRWAKVAGGRIRLVDEGPRVADPGRAATWVTVEETKPPGDAAPDRPARRVSVISVHHMVNPAEIGPDRALRRELYAEGMRRLRDLIARLSATTPVIVAGDFNSPYAANDPWGPRVSLGAIGMRCSFDALGPAPTHDNGTTIDYVFYFSAQTSTVAQRTAALNSDHRALIVRLRGPPND